MALFWTLAEGLILIYMRRGFLIFKMGKPQQRGFNLFCGTMFIILVFIMLGGESLLGRFMDLGRGLNFITYRWALWNFFCTLWVVLEGIIMIYVLRIYKLLAPAYNKKTFSAKGSVKKGPAIGIPLLIFSFFILYLFYEYNLLSVINNYGLKAGGVNRISVFYIRICGLFWIIFEWIVAFIGIKTFFIMKEKKAGK